MHENRTVYPEKKAQMYQQLQELPKKYSVLALVRMEKVRGSQLLPLRKKLQGEVEIVSIKDKVAKLALAKAGITGVDKLAQDKRASRKFINKYDFFLADTKLMPLVGKSLGQLLGPRGKMPTPVPFNAPIESFLSRFKTSIRVRVKNSLSITCKVGDVTMDEHQVAGNAMTVINNLSAKLPNGNKNIRKYMIKTTMGKAIKLEHKVTK